MINGIDYLKKIYSNMDEECFQPSGVDLKLGKVYELDDYLICGLVNGQKFVPEHIEIKPQYVAEYGYEEVWRIESLKPYIFEVDRQIQIGDNNAQFYLPRSTLLRCGVNVCTALGDLGYNGHLSFLVVNYRKQPFYIQKGERFAQLVDFEVKGGSESYKGDYQEEIENE